MFNISWLYAVQQLVGLMLLVLGIIGGFRLAGPARGLIGAGFATLLVGDLGSIGLNLFYRPRSSSAIALVYSVPWAISMIGWGLVVAGVWVLRSRLLAGLAGRLPGSPYGQPPAGYVGAGYPGHPGAAGWPGQVGQPGPGGQSGPVAPGGPGGQPGVPPGGPFTSSGYQPVTPPAGPTPPNYPVPPAPDPAGPDATGRPDPRR